MPVGRIGQQHVDMALQVLLQFDMLMVLEQVRSRVGRTGL